MVPDISLFSRFLPIDTKFPSSGHGSYIAIQSVWQDDVDSESDTLFSLFHFKVQRSEVVFEVKRKWGHARQANLVS